MNHRISGLALAAFLALAAVGCGTSSQGLSPAGVKPDTTTPPVSESDLRLRLLTGADLGQDYTEVPTSPARTDGVGMSGCPALEKLDGPSGDGALDFATRVKASFTYSETTGGSISKLGEELYSDTPAKLAQSTKALFDAYASCPSFNLNSGTTPVKIEIKKETPPKGLGDEQYAQTMTVVTGSSTTVLRQTAVRAGTIMVMLSGEPSLVTKELPAAVQKAKGK
ncbi:hypothetical protein [Streptomyces sp. NBC_01244]|uniref:hypothetical protein n=1 Tax=Streptomyces sp. NBC_01244 TaxID=2903797 RepID=UPI002E137182|nr:hypothetical protein OG247_44200 [Streptomyces sp. NBC_01244]